MGRDRLAALRAQRQGAAPDAGQGAYEMQPPPADGNGTNGAAADALSAFYAETSAIQDSIQQFDANVTRIADLHSRSLNALDDAATQANIAQLDSLTNETRQLSNGLANRIQALERPAGAGQDAQIRKNRIDFVRTKFMTTLQRYQDVERQYRQQYRQRVERQFKIVKPDATPDEVAAVVNDDQGGGQIFAQALTSSTRYGDSRVAYKEVQERHQELRMIEQTLGELAQLFNDMATLLNEQEEKIDAIETQAAGVTHDTEGGLKHTEVAVKHARSARRKRWYCFFLTLVIILAAVGIGVGVYFGQKHNSS
ncbi:t-SNARE [Rhizopogon vinicolor AM-OR11-026]|uniref:t-SNARE n=1 Tax=Rhizopogon vinicolor AM-OR11-026 TaxID=1314800 RepID=A0A1B7NFP1_9AGAM|nr:t-SNARE [Rhizopogon vinicolor AM-OR11-026]